MATDVVVRLVHSVVAEKSAIANKERQLIANLNRALTDMGYHVVPVARAARGRGRASGPVRGADKTLPCPHCPRSFAHPLHLGRHVAAMHKARRRRKGAKTAKK